VHTFPERHEAAPERPIKPRPRPSAARVTVVVIKRRKRAVRPAVGVYEAQEGGAK